MIKPPSHHVDNFPPVTYIEIVYPAGHTTVRKERLCGSEEHLPERLGSSFLMYSRQSKAENMQRTILVPSHKDSPLLKFSHQPSSGIENLGETIRRMKSEGRIMNFFIVKARLRLRFQQLIIG